MAIKPHQRKSLIANVERPKVGDLAHAKGLVFSLKHLDKSQGQTFDQWESERLLADMLVTLHGFCQRESHLECRGDSFTVYGSFPKKSDFKHPEHVPPDAQWARIHVKGKPCIGGHVFQNIFYIVFLDKDHRFWVTEKKNS